MLVALHKVVARVRGADPSNYAENRDTEQLHINSLGDQIIGSALTPQAELVRMGESYVIFSNAVTGLTAIPTTTGLMTLWNGEPGNGKFLAIDSVQVVKIIVDVTTNDLATIWVQNVKPPVAAPSDLGLAIRSLSGRYSYGGRVRSIGSVTAVAGQWLAIGQVPNVSAAIGGSAWAQADIPLRGSILVPPGGAFTVTASEVTATASTFRIAIRWHEVLLPLAG